MTIKYTDEVKHSLLDKLRTDNDLCSLEYPGIRRVIYQYRKWGFPIESLRCTKMECINKRKHVSYTYEWAREYRNITNKEFKRHIWQ